MTVRWHRDDTDADDALRRHVADVVDVESDAVTVGRLCGRCGSSGHGRPWADHGVQVSLARAGPHLLTAVSTGGAVGVDVESIADAERAWSDLSTLLRAPIDLLGSARAAWWCRTEATLKREGTGLAVGPEVLHAPAGKPGRVDDLVAPDGYCAAVAIEE